MAILLLMLVFQDSMGVAPFPNEESLLTFVKNGEPDNSQGYIFPYDIAFSLTFGSYFPLTQQEALLIYQDSQNTCQINLFRKIQGQWVLLQAMKQIPYVFSLNPDFDTVCNQHGFFIQNDHKGQSVRFFAFDQGIGQLKQVAGFEDIGHPMAIAGRSDLFHGYRSCGCSDSCWTSHLSRIEDFKVVRLATMACDCRHLTITNASGLVLKQSTCEGQNGHNKFGLIQQNWLETIQMLDQE